MLVCMVPYDVNIYLKEGRKRSSFMFSFCLWFWFGFVFFFVST